jgi:thiol-disulfide isomerase/thioredoxin
MYLLKSCIAVLLITALHACSGAATKTVEPEEQAVAQPAPAVQQEPASETLPHFMVQDVSGNTVDLQQFKGKKVFVNLWATWCPPCRAEMPSIEKLYQAADKEKTQFVMLSLDNNFESARKYVQDKKLDLPIFYPAADLPPLFTVNGIPTTFIFNEDGKLIAKREGSENYDTPSYRKLFDAK